MTQHNPVAAMADAIEAHVADRERDLIERMRDALMDAYDILITANPTEKVVTFAMTNCVTALAEADAYLAEPRRGDRECNTLGIEPEEVDCVIADPAYGTVTKGE